MFQIAKNVNSVNMPTMSTMSTMSTAGDKTIEIVESAKLPQLAHHLRPIFALVYLRL